MEIEDSQSDSQTNKTWLGNSISDICKGKGYWSFNVTPIVVCKYHAVLYQLPATLKEPPKPHYSGSPQHWDENYVRMPFSEKNLFPVKENGEEVAKLRWSIIKENLSQPIRNSKELEKAIHSYNNLPKFLSLHHFFNEVLEEDEADHFFSNLLPKIICLALSLPDIIPGSLPLLRKNYNRSVSLSQLQIACLLANAFLCTFPWRKDMAVLYPGVNFSRLYTSHMREKRRDAVSEKLKCIFHYFKRVTTESPVGVVTFERKFHPKSSMPRWDNSDINLGNTKVHVDSAGTIEDDGLGFLQVDFANKNVGGGVLGYGCVQEEIRFVICPELIVSRLFVEQLGDQEAVVVTGPERYSNYVGYGDSFQWSGNVNDETPFDEYGRRRTSVCIIDATHFNKLADQFYPSAMLRELNKAYVGFSSRDKENVSPVATGNWGCGAFRGSVYLKALLQLMACSAAGRDLVYYTFGNVELRDQFYEMYLFLATNKITITLLWRFLCNFCQQKVSQDDLYSYVQQAFFDNKRQPKIKKFFGVSFKKKEDGPSTSGETYNASAKKNSGDGGFSKNSASEKYADITSEPNNSFEDDIIPGTPPEELVKFKKKGSKIKPKFTKEEIAEKLPKTNIIELIDIIDGNNVDKSSGNVKEQTFLAQIDMLSKKVKNDLSQQSPSSPIDESEKMEVDISPEKTTDSESRKINSANENKSTKRKISDYFQKSFKSS